MQSGVLGTWSGSQHLHSEDIAIVPLQQILYLFIYLIGCTYLNSRRSRVKGHCHLTDLVAGLGWAEAKGHNSLLVLVAGSQALSRSLLPP